jgi:glycosyltransferase involved in cell wall biosynthesis
VLLIVYGSLETLSGGYLYDRTLVRRLEAEGHQVRVASQTQRTPYLANLAGNADPSLVREAVSWQPDVIVEDELNHPSLFMLNRTLKKRIPAPRIGLVHHLKSIEEGPVLEQAAARYMEKTFLAGLDGYIFNSEFTRKSVETALGSSNGAHPQDRSQALGKPFVVALPGKDRLAGLTAPGTSSGRDGGALRLLFLGNVIPRKGLHLLVAALARVAARPWSLSIAGGEDTAYGAEIRKQIRESGLESRVSWLGAVEDGELPGIFRSHDVLTVPSQCEGFGIVYAEAMSFGLPVIAGELGGAGELVNPGENGFLVRWGDDEGLAGRLAQLIDSPGLLASMSSKAREKAEVLPTWDDSMGKIVEFLTSLSRLTA